MVFLLVQELSNFGFIEFSHNTIFSFVCFFYKNFIATKTQEIKHSNQNPGK